MKSISSIFENALLSDAAYVAADAQSAGWVGALCDRLSKPLAEELQKLFSIKAAFTAPGSGLDLFVANRNDDGSLILVFRGTESAADIAADIDLSTSALARTQLVDMVNWWFKATTPVGESARQIELGLQFSLDGYVIPFTSHFAEAPAAAGLGLISAADLVRGIEVTGHSLGGYLATAFTRLFGSEAHVLQTTTFNSAGFAPGAEQAFAELQNLIGPSYGLGRFSNAVEQSNVFAANAITVANLKQGDQR